MSNKKNWNKSYMESIAKNWNKNCKNKQTQWVYIKVHLYGVHSKIFDGLSYLLIIHWFKSVLSSSNNTHQ